MRFTKFLIPVIAALLFTLNAHAADDKFITVASTTSTANSGLFDVILPVFTKKTGIEVRVVRGRHRQGDPFGPQRRCRRAVRAP